jgi:nanoRNase/pAp phosphatase (c-di-AMP/oligoRNAs hydrolase)
MTEKTSVKTLLEIVGEVDQVMILPHNNPDPDALASAMALGHLLSEETGVTCSIGFGGIIGRAENKAFASYLGVPHWQDISGIPADQTAGIVLVDTQPGMGNVNIPAGIPLLAVIDDHDKLPGTEITPFSDLRSGYGAVSSILVEYYQATGRSLTKVLATGLFYGIKSNTLGLSRNASRYDAAAYYYLQPKIDVGALGKIEQARVPAAYFKSFDLALRSARLYNDLVISDLGEITYPDLTAEIADLLLRLERANWVVCTGIYFDTLMISVRTRRRKYNAEQLALALAAELGMAGGHGTIAGGQIPLTGQDIAALLKELTRRALVFNRLPFDAEGITLLENGL